MAEINEIISQQHIDRVTELTKVFKGLNDVALKFAETANLLEGQMGENAKAAETVTQKQQVLTDSKKQAETINKQLNTTIAKRTAAEKGATKELEKEKIALQERNRQVKESVKIDNAKAGSMQKLSLELAKNKKAYAGLSKAERENINVGGKLLKTIQSQDKEIKGLDKSIGNTQRNVGNYESAIGDLSGVTGEYGIIVTRLITTLKGLRDALLTLSGAATVAEAGQIKSGKASLFFAKAMKILKIAMISTGIGAFVVIIGSLIAYFKRTEEGATKLQKILAPFKALFGVIGDLAGDIGEFLVDAFSNPKKSIIELWELIKTNIVNRFKGLVKQFGAFGRILEGVFTLDRALIKEGAKEFGDAWLQTLTGVEDFVGKVGDAWDYVAGKAGEIIEKSKIQIQLEDDKLQLVKDRRKFIVDEAKKYSEIADLILFTRDIEGNRAEQQQALIDAEAIQREISAQQLKIAEDELRIKKAEAALADSDADTLDEIAQLEADLFKLRKTEADKVREIVNRQNELQTKINSELKAELLIRQKIADEAAKVAFYLEEEEEAPDPKDLPDAKKFIAIMDFAKKATSGLKSEYEIREEDLLEAYETGIINYKEYQAALTALAKEGEDERNAKIDAGFTAAAALGNAFFDIKNNQMQADLNNFQTQKDFELQMAGDNAEKKAMIESKYTKKMNALKKKQMENDKKQALFNAIINTAAAIVSASLTTPFIPLGLIAVALAGALGIAQVATISSQPIPAFKGGTQTGTPFGPIMWGEAGRELYKTRSGQIGLSPGSASLASPGMGTKIIPNRETEMIMAAAFGGGGTDRALQETMTRNNDRLIRTIQNKRELHIYGGGKKITERKGSFYRNWYNKKILN